MARQDNPKCLSRYALWINVLLKLGFIWTTFFSPSSCQDALVLECPAVFRNGENLIYCTVNTTALNEAGCTGVGAVIGFQITLPGQSPLTTCDADLNNCVSTFNSDGCRCVSHASGLKRYQLNFTGDSSVHTNGSFDCIISCFPGSPPPTVKDPSCDPIDFTPPVTSAPGCPICKKDPDCDKPDWICLLFLLLLIPIVILIIILWYFFVHKPKTGDICGTMNAEEGVPKGSPQNQQTSNGTKPADGKGSSQSQQTTNGNRTVDGKGSSQSQQTTNGNRTVDGKGAHNGEKVSKPVQETELTKVKKTSSAPSGEEETSLNGPRSV